MNIGQCKLCLKENVDLLRKSHIIPDFFHTGLKNENGKYSLVLPDAYVKGRKQHLKSPSGAMFESDLLCANCDNNIIGSYEMSLSKMLKQNKDNSIPFSHEGKNYRIYKNVEYDKIKLGLLSILWRASIAENEMFEQVNINSNHAETIRLMILNNDAKDVSHYPVLCYLFNENDEKLITEPRFLDEVPHQKAQFIINGYMYLFIIGVDSSFSPLLVPNFSGEWFLEIMDENYLKKHISQLMEFKKEKLNNKG